MYPDLGDGDVGAGQVRVAEIAALEQHGQHMADFLGHPQLALRGTFGLVATMPVHGDGTLPKSKGRGPEGAAPGKAGGRGA